MKQIKDKGFNETQSKPGMEDNFIRSYNNVLTDDQIDSLTELATNQISWHENHMPDRIDKQLSLEAYYPEKVHVINTSLLRCFSSYVKDFPYLVQLRDEWASCHTILQMTQPTGGYHVYHCENNAWCNVTRTVAWMIYLNDVEEGGETDFLYQKVRVKPTKGTALFWPGGFTHIHRGNPPISNNKYILTGWFAPLAGMYRFKMEGGSSM